MKALRIGILLISLIFVVILFAEEQSKANQQTIDHILAKIRFKQNVQVNHDIKPENIDESDLIMLGNQVLKKIFPEQDKRKFMEEMMINESGIDPDSFKSKLGLKFIKDGYILPVNIIDSIETKEDYHIAYGEILIILALIMIIILINIYHCIRKFTKSHTIKNR